MVTDWMMKTTVRNGNNDGVDDDDMKSSAVTHLCGSSGSGAKVGA
jgi:hypothetical protein